MTITSIKRSLRSTIPLWAKLTNVPLEAWSKEGISALVSSLGKPIIMDNMTSQICRTGMGKVDYARVLVEFDVKKGFKDKIVMQYRSKDNEVKGSKTVNVEYIWKPGICSLRCVFGHELKNYTKRPITEEGIEDMQRKNEAFSNQQNGFTQVNYNRQGSFRKVNGNERYQGNGKNERKHIWKELEAAKSIINDDHWMLSGDFNVILNPGEHSVDSLNITNDMHDLIYCVNNIEVEDIASSRLFYTWIKSPLKASANVMKKLDRIMVNGVPGSIPKRSKAFRFVNYIADKPEFIYVVEEAMEAECLVKYLEAVADGEKLLFQKLKLNEGVRYKGSRIAEEFVKHFKQFLGPMNNVEPIIDINNLFVTKLDNQEALNMVRDITDMEIKNAIYDIGETKAPGLDGFTSAFFKNAWCIMGDDVCAAIRYFFSNGKLLGYVNATLISLVPKV
ncbi:RNA-directed DNA polymerase, eukaryota, reverse transcriptase zinc-binding domain protein [Tanacetum coccineum]